VVAICNSCKTTAEVSKQPAKAIDIQLPYSGTPVKKEITFPKSYGTGEPISIPMEFQWNQSDKTFDMTFKGVAGRESKYIYLFARKGKMSDYSDVSFWKQLKKDAKKVVRAYSDKSTGKGYQKYKLSKDFTITFKDDFDGKVGFEGAFYAYFTDNRGEQIIFLAEVPFKIYLGGPCEDEQVKAKIREFEDTNSSLTVEISKIQEETKKLNRENSKKLPLKNLKYENEYPYGECKGCGSCEQFNAEKDKLYNTTIKEYNAAIADYNKTLQKFQGTVACRCDCKTLKNFIDGDDGLGKLKTNLKLNQIDKGIAKDKLDKIKKSNYCIGGDCKDCNSVCSKDKECKKDYETFQKLCADIESLLK
jgi:hypothetical protein